MAALIADTSPMLPKIPSESVPDRRSFGFSPQSPMSFARYLAEGRQSEHGRHQSPNHRSYTAHQTPSPYPRGYGYNVQEAFPYDDTNVSVRVTPKSCRCPRECTCAAGPCPNFSKSDSATAMWRKEKPDGKAVTSGTQGLYGVGASARPMSAKSLAVSMSTQSDRDLVEDMPRPSKKHKSDWENLLGAVDLELRAQKRAESVPETISATVSSNVSPGSCASRRHPLHPSAGDNFYSSASAEARASGSPDIGPYKPTHRRGGDTVSGGGPAYSGSTADAACLLATLPQRMLDRASKSGAAPKPPPVSMSSPSLVSTPLVGSVPGQPLRVQASGRRGPRGQSRFKGVCITRAGKWRAVIYIGRKQKYLGVFDSEFDAARAYDASALQHFAEGAKLNFPDGIEQQLHDLSNSGKAPFSTAGARSGSGGAAAARSATPPALDQSEDAGNSAARKRSRKSSFGVNGDEDEWIRGNGPWNSSRR